MKLTDVFLFIVYGMAAGYVIYFMSYIYNRSTGSVVYNETIPVYSETVVYPWLGGRYNWWPYWGGWWSGGGDGGYNGRDFNRIDLNRRTGSYHSGNRPWGDGGRGANGDGGRGANGDGGRGANGDGGRGANGDGGRGANGRGISGGGGHSGR